jgi:hypothetical protein
MTIFRLCACLILAVGLAACATPMPGPNEVRVPTPILGNSGEYMSPYTQDGVLALWVDKAVNAKLGATIGATVGAVAGQQALGYVPLVGGFLGQMAGEQIGRSIAIEASGGEEYIKSTSDISFATLDDLSVYIYAKNSTHPNYADALSATMEIYPGMKTGYGGALQKARIGSR